MENYSLISAVGTPLNNDDSLHLEGLERHLEDQWHGRITGILVGGTMGLMQLLSDQTYADLVMHTVRHSSGRGEIMIGAGDTSLARTRDRVQFLNKFKLDGVVVLNPFFWEFEQSQLINYFSRLAEESTNPLFLYDLPALTGTKLTLETVLKLSEHRNIRGIKCSGQASWTRQLRDLAPTDFRVIFAEADLIDALMRHGIREHLDGIFAIAPHWTAAIAEASAAGQWAKAAQHQQRLSALLRLFIRYGVFQSTTAVLNARGIPGKFSPAPMEPLSETDRKKLLAERLVQELVRGDAPQVSVVVHATKQTHVQPASVGNGQ